VRGDPAGTFPYCDAILRLLLSLSPEGRAPRLLTIRPDEGTFWTQKRKLEKAIRQHSAAVQASAASGKFWQAKAFGA